ncbi:hypothetical protein QE418_002505 [Microbacterium testaceum]|nr:hypothetical protein [Microbacterium testaceum]
MPWISCHAALRGDGGAEVAQQLDAGLDDVGETVADRLRVHGAVVRGVGGREAGEAVGVLGPREGAAVDDHAADRGAVPAEELRRRVHDDVGAVLEGADQVRGRDRVVDDERHTRLVRRVGDRADVEDVDLGVADGLGEEQLRVRSDRGAPLLGVVLVLDERGLDAELGEGVLEEVVGAAVDRARRDDVVAGLCDVEHGEGLGRLAAGDEEGAGAALEARDALLDDVLRGVLDARVDVAELGQREEVRGVVGVVEHVRGRLVDRGGASLRDRVGLRTRVDLLGLETPVLGYRHDCSSASGGRAVAVACCERRDSLGRRQATRTWAVTPLPCRCRTGAIAWMP